jgi:hypothetical protein
MSIGVSFSICIISLKILNYENKSNSLILELSLCFNVRSRLTHDSFKFSISYDFNFLILIQNHKHLDIF